MNLYYCSLYYRNDYVTGANKRFDEIGFRLLNSDLINFFCIITKGNRPSWCPIENCIEIEGFSNKIGRLKSWLLLSALLIKLEKGILYNDFQPKPLFFSLYKHKHFQLVHDLRNFNEFKRGGLGKFSAFFQRNQFRNSKYIVAVSNYTANLVKKLCSKSESEIIVSYNGVSNGYDGSFQERDIDILYIATYEERKNHIRLLEALGNIKCRKLNVVFLGSDLGDKSKVLNKSRLVHSSSGHSFDFLEQISENDLIDIYKRSKVFCSPSLYEGFGMPLIEAYKYGCLVICSDIEIFREVTLNKAIYFNPLDVDSMTKTIEESLLDYFLLLDSDQAKNITNYFSWDQITNRLLEDMIEK